MKHGKRISYKTRTLSYTDKPPAGKPLTALRWTLGAVDTSSPDAPATQAHTGRIGPPPPADDGEPQPPSHTGQAYEAPRPAGGPHRSPTPTPAPTETTTKQRTSTSHDHH